MNRPVPESLRPGLIRVSEIARATCCMQTARQWQSYGALWDDDWRRHRDCNECGQIQRGKHLGGSERFAACLPGLNDLRLPFILSDKSYIHAHPSWYYRRMAASVIQGAATSSGCRGAGGGLTQCY